MQRTTCSVQHPTSDVRAAGRPLEAADLSDAGRKVRQQITPGKRRTAHTCHLAYTALRSCDMCAWIAAASPLRSALARSCFTQTIQSAPAKEHTACTCHTALPRRSAITRSRFTWDLQAHPGERLEPAPTFAPTDPPTHTTHAPTHLPTYTRRRTGGYARVWCRYGSPQSHGHGHAMGLASDSKIVKSKVLPRYTWYTWKIVHRTHGKL